MLSKWEMLEKRKLSLKWVILWYPYISLRAFIWTSLTPMIILMKHIHNQKGSDSRLRDTRSLWKMMFPIISSSIVLYMWPNHISPQTRWKRLFFLFLKKGKKNNNKIRRRRRRREVQRKKNREREKTQRVPLGAEFF